MNGNVGYPGPVETDGCYVNDSAEVGGRAGVIIE